jgi:hypothetical protein
MAETSNISHDISVSQARRRYNLIGCAIMIVMTALLFGSNLYELLKSGQYDFGNIASVIGALCFVLVFGGQFRRIYTERGR